jgi:hypothetical protein
MMRTKHRISMLRVDLRNSFDLFRVFFFFFTLKLIYNRLNWLLMKHVDMVNGLAKVKVELMNLLLKKVNDSVMLGNESIAGRRGARARWRRQSRRTTWRACKRAREEKLERRSGWGRRVE